YYCFSKNVHLKSLGKVRLIFSFENPELEGTCAMLITNQLTWHAKKIIETYLLRWPIETFYQDAKQQRQYERDCGNCAAGRLHHSVCSTRRLKDSKSKVESWLADNS
ncbi:MAG: hypothetical protein U9Q70_11010, partial [Chloroflexota bacterium]|nr:hypothetical protein [Chloroflexota bacterium]